MASAAQFGFGSSVWLRQCCLASVVLYCFILNLASVAIWLRSSHLALVLLYGFRSIWLWSCRLALATPFGFSSSIFLCAILLGFGVIFPGCHCAALSSGATSSGEASSCATSASRAVLSLGASLHSFLHEIFLCAIFLGAIFPGAIFLGATVQSSGATSSGAASTWAAFFGTSLNVGGFSLGHSRFCYGFWPRFLPQRFDFGDLILSLIATFQPLAFAHHERFGGCFASFPLACNCRHLF